jgi:hypothetical protein
MDRDMSLEDAIAEDLAVPHVNYLHLDSIKVDAVRLTASPQQILKRSWGGTACMAQLSPAELVALIAGQIVAGRGDSSAQVISEAVEAAVRILDAAEAAVAARHATGR